MRIDVLTYWYLSSGGRRRGASSGYGGADDGGLGDSSPDRGAGDAVALVITAVLQSVAPLLQRQTELARRA